MSTPVLTFFNNKGAVGKTSLVFHLAWMFSEMGKRVVTIDLDPQAHLTSACLSQDTLETKGGDLLAPITQRINPNLFLVPGHLGLASFEDELSRAWPDAMGANKLHRPFRWLTAFWQVAQMAAQAHQADIILTDVGSNLGAINRSALIGSDHVVIPLAADLFSLQVLGALGPTLTDWRAGWRKRVGNWPKPDFDLPNGAMQSEGYVVMQHLAHLFRPTKANSMWADRIPSTYRDKVLGQASPEHLGANTDNCLARLKHYRSLVPMAQEVRKPIFHLTAADGAIGSHSLAVRDAWSDFKALAVAILDRIDLPESKGPLA